jgi:hypothetical protein
MKKYAHLRTHVGDVDRDTDKRQKNDILSVDRNGNGSGYSWDRTLSEKFPRGKWNHVLINVMCQVGHKNQFVSPNQKRDGTQLVVLKMVMWNMGL